MNQLLKYLLLISICAGCSVVEVEQSTEERSDINVDGTFPNSAIDVNEYLLGGSSRTWTTLEFTIDGVEGFQQCRLDDQIVLHEDNTYNYDGGDSLCGAEDDQKLKSGVWAIDVDKRTLTFDGGSAREAVFYIESLTEEAIVVSSHYYSWKVMGKFTHE